jgi:sarcosine reductase
VTNREVIPLEDFILRRIRISKVELGSKTEVKDGCLFVDAEGLSRVLCEDKQIRRVDIRLARPGESVRIVPVKDVIEPRAKVSGGRETFPGVFSDPDVSAGEGVTVVLDGVCVVTTGKMVNFQEGLIDMSGLGAEFSTFSRKNNVVLVIEPVEGLGKHEHERAVRLAGLKAASILGEAGRDVRWDEETRIPRLTLPELYESHTGLPRVVYVCQVIAEGLLHDSYIYGLNAQGCLPVWMPPGEVLDGSLVSGNCAAPCHKHSTYHHQNNPIVEDLLKEHGKSLNFLGVLVTPVKTALVEKVRMCTQALKMVRLMGAHGVVLSEDGGGNPENDLMLLDRLLEKEGIRTVLVTDEYAGSDGASPGLADSTPEADAVVTNGNGNQRVILPPMDETIGYPECIDRITGGHAGSLRPDGSVDMEIAGIMGSTNELGLENLMTVAM